MSSLRFVTLNQLEQSWAVLKNGTGGGAPARDEVSPFLMEKAMKHDRKLVWQQASGGPMQVDFDLSANRTISIAGLFGHRALGPNAIGIYSSVIQYATAATGYPPAGGGGSWTTVSSLPVSALDAGILFSPVVARYWRFDLDAVFGPFMLGKFLLGTVDQDLGILYADAGFEPNIPVAVDRSFSKHPNVTVIGDERQDIELGYRMSADAIRYKLLALMRLGNSFIMINESDVFSEVFLRDFRLPGRHRWRVGSTNYWDVSLLLEQLA